MNKLSLNPIKSHYDIDIEVENSTKTYTNGDIIRGEVKLAVAPEEDVAISGIAVALKAMSYTMLEDASSTPTFEGHGETHEMLNVVERLFPTDDLQAGGSKAGASYSFPQGTHRYPFEFRLPEAGFNLQCLSGGELFHKRGYIKDGLVAPPVALPPSLIYEKGISNYARIEYSVDVSVQKTSTSKPTIENKFIFTFLPKFNLVTFSSAKIVNLDLSGKMFEFKYRESGDLESGTYSNGSSSGGGGGTSHGNGESASKLVSLFKKAFSSSKIMVPFELQAAFVPHLEPYNTQYNSSRILQSGDNLKDVLRVSLLTTLSYGDLIKRIHPSNANTADANLSYEPETLVLNKIKVKLVSNLVFKSQIFSDARGFRTVLVSRDNVSYPISHRDFQSIGTLSAQTTNKSGSDTSTQRVRKQLGAAAAASGKGSSSKSPVELYKFELPGELLDAPIGALLPSFVTCNIKVEHSLHVTAKFTSSINPKQSAVVKLRPDVVLLKDYYKNAYKYKESLPVYTANYESSDEE